MWHGNYNISPKHHGQSDTNKKNGFLATINAQKRSEMFFNCLKEISDSFEGIPWSMNLWFYASNINCGNFSVLVEIMVGYYHPVPSSHSGSVKGTAFSVFTTPLLW